MPEYLSPGVYVEEIDTGSKPIEGVSTSTAGFIGVAERGPVNVPMLVTSVGEYSRLFGGRLPLALFRNSNGPHCFLPYAVEGFFGNGGKRLFVTRVIDEGAALRAEFELHDRGDATSAETLLLRNAAEGTGTALSTVPLYVVATNLSGGGVLNNADAIRIGDGSAAEYMTVDVVGGTATDVPLDFPLVRSHARVPLPGFDVQSLVLGAPTAFTMNPLTTGGAVAARIGTVTISLSGTPANILALAPGDLLEIGTGARREFRFVRAITPIDASNARVRLDSALMLSHAAAAPGNAVNRYALAALAGDGHLEMAAVAGDRVTFVSPLPAAYVPGTVLVFGFSDLVNREARVMGSLFGVSVAGVSAGVYPAGSVVEPVTIADAGREVVTSAGTTLTLNDQTLLGPGMAVQLGTAAAGNLETVTIDHIDATTNDIILTAVPTFAHGAGDPALPSFVLKRLTADAGAGATVIALDNRQLLNAGDVLRIDDGGSVEFATIASLPNQSGIAPDDGPVVLGSPLTLPHDGPTATTPGILVRQQTAAAVDTTKPPSTLAFASRNLDDVLVVTNGTGYLAGDHVRITTGTGQVAVHRVTTAPTALTPQPVTLTDPLQRRHAGGAPLVQRDPLIFVQALDSGMWGNRLRISAEDEPTGIVARTTITFNGGASQIRLASAAGIESGTILELFDPADDTVHGRPVKVEAVDRTANYLISLAAPGLSPIHLAALAAGPVAVRSREFRLTVWLLNPLDPARPQRADVIDSEMFRNLSMDPRHSRYFQTILGDINGPLRREDRRPEGESDYVRVHDLAQDLLEPGRTQALHGIRLGPEALIDVLPTGRLRAARHPFAGGDDSVPSMSDAMYIGLDNVQAELRTGLYSFTAEDDISIVAVPGRTSADLQGRVIEHCELMRYRFAVLDSSVPPGDSLNDVQFQRQQFDTKYAGLYYPWILIPDPFPVNLANVGLLPIPPSGHVTGVYARTDVERGVHKAPANEVVRGVVGLQRIINAGEHDMLNPYPVNINVIRDFRPNNRGIRIWGARVITSDSDYKYVNVRRLLIFIEKSLERGLQWVVFEPNAEPLWARVVRSISNFLTVVWRNGALEGTKKEEAFYVRCDRTTMTQTDIDSGRLICVIGVAPVKPAEFVIIRIGLWTAHAED